MSALFSSPDTKELKQRRPSILGPQRSPIEENKGTNPVKKVKQLLGE